MSYIKKIENDYNGNLISLDQLGELRAKYSSSSKKEKEELDSIPISKLEEDSDKLILSNMNANIGIIKNILLFFFSLTILGLILQLYFLFS
jgi:hypothetical protein